MKAESSPFQADLESAFLPHPVQAGLCGIICGLVSVAQGQEVLCNVLCHAHVAGLVMQNHL